MDFLSAKTLEGKLRVTFHVVKYGEECGGGGGGMGMHGRWRRKEKLLLRETKGEKYSRAGAKKRISKAK